VARINDFDPEDLERVEVIKGPAAATLYGAEASRGVIQMLTRRGTPGPARFEFIMKQGATWFDDPAGRISPVFCCKDAVTGTLDSLNLIQQEGDAGNPIFTTGHPQAYGANVSGGSERVRYYVSGSFGREEGMLAYNWRERVSTRANLSIVSSDKLDIETRVGFVRNRARLAQAPAAWDIMSQIVLGSPLKDTTSLRRFYLATPEDISTVDVRSYTDRITASVHFDHHPSSWFSQRLTVGTDIGDETSSTLFPADPAGTDGPFANLSLGDIEVERQHASVGSLDYSASGSFPVTSALRSVTSLGAQAYDHRVDYVRAHGSSLPVGVSAISGAATTDANGDLVQNRGAGVYVQEQLGWKNRAFLTVALRGDDNSVFGENIDFVTIQVSGTWVVSEGPFWRGLRGAPNTVKLRAAWGQAGQQPDAFAAERSYQPITGPGGVSALTPQNIGNPDLRPERGEELEIGFDAGAFGDRVATTFTYYHQSIQDAIVPRLLAPSSGFPGTQLVNLGNVANWGFEVSLDARVTNRASFAWDVGVSFATNDSRVVSMGGVPPIYLNQQIGNALGTGQWQMEGYPLGAYLLPLVVSASLDPSGRPVNIMCASGPQPNAPPAPCDNSEQQRLYAGQPMPTWMGSLRSMVTLSGNLRLSAVIDFRGGNHVWYQTATYAVRQVGNTRAVNERTDPIFLAYDSLSIAGVVGANARQGLIDGGYAKLREVALTYTLPRSAARHVGAFSATITVAGRNLATLWQAQKEIYGVKVTDPEARPQFDQAATIFNLLPQYAQFMTALRLSF
jgi:outer membrane receptor protein involved in Fe transport